MHAKEILHLTGAMPETVPHDGRFHLPDAITVSARVDAETNRPEAMQALVSKWAPPDVWPGFAAHDASTTDGLDTTGYFGAVFDGIEAELMERAYADAYRQFIEPVVGASGEHLVRVSARETPRS